MEGGTTLPQDIADAIGVVSTRSNFGALKLPGGDLVTPQTPFVGTASSVPATVLLEQNYPNPFNISTMIPFSMSKSGLVTLKIYNLLGQEIDTLLQDHHSAGEYKIIWSAEGLPGGIYFYRLQVVVPFGVGENSIYEFVETKKLICMK